VVSYLKAQLESTQEMEQCDPVKQNRRSLTGLAATKSPDLPDITTDISRVHQRKSFSDDATDPETSNHNEEECILQSYNLQKQWHRKETIFREAGNYNNYVFREKKNKKECFLLANRFLPAKLVGKGAYGVVCSAIDKETSQPIAIKKIKIVYDQKHVPRQAYLKRTLREVKILRLLSRGAEHNCVLNFQQLCCPLTPLFEDVQIVLPLLDLDLSEIIRSGEKLSADHCKFFLYQMLSAIRYIHSAGIIHRDLKPRNILVNANCDLRIADFGLARWVESDDSPDDQHMSDYIATRWYRAPEVMLTYKTYTKAIDIWALGCVFAELLTGRAIFPGKHEKDQVKRIVAIVGSPSELTLEECTVKASRRFVRSLPITRGKDFKTLFPKAEKFERTLIKQMLTFDPEKRPSADDLLNESYFSLLYVGQDPVFENHDLMRREMAFEKVKTKDPYKLYELLQDEVLCQFPGSFCYDKTDEKWILKENSNSNKTKQSTPPIKEKPAEAKELIP